MSYRINITIEAGEDIENIYDYTEENIDKQTAIDQNKNIREIINTLSEFPYRHPLYEIKDEKQRNWKLHGMPIGRYMVLYEIEEERKIVHIARVVHGARNIETQLLNTK
ncbi:MAG: type II toxin-antitoxin system RelE/ParE family toxin [Coprobacillus sp.]|nr:type II toxin-antitoxin system RelE/ParE family toxin [Coprobacillus sp.]